MEWDKTPTRQYITTNGRKALFTVQRRPTTYDDSNGSTVDVADLVVLWWSSVDEVQRHLSGAGGNTNVVDHRDDNRTAYDTVARASVPSARRSGDATRTSLLFDDGRSFRSLSSFIRSRWHLWCVEWDAKPLLTNSLERYSELARTDHRLNVFVS